MAVIDILSTIPFEFIAAVAISSSKSDLESLAGLRILRVLRLTKLLRILRSSRVLRRLEDHTNFHYGYLTLTKFGVGTLLLTHWMACLFHLVVVRIFPVPSGPFRSLCLAYSVQLDRSLPLFWYTVHEQAPDLDPLSGRLYCLFRRNRIATRAIGSTPTFSTTQTCASSKRLGCPHPRC